MTVNYGILSSLFGNLQSKFFRKLQFCNSQRSKVLWNTTDPTKSRNVFNTKQQSSVGGRFSGFGFFGLLYLISESMDWLHSNAVPTTSVTR